MGRGWGWGLCPTCDVSQYPAFPWDTPVLNPITHLTPRPEHPDVRQPKEAPNTPHPLGHPKLTALPPPRCD